MSVFAAILLTVATFAFIVYPLWRQKQRPAAGPVEDERLQELQARRDTTYSMLRELEFDHQSGLLTDDDYRDLEERYKGKAISILKSLDWAEQGGDIDDDIEQAVLKLRQRPGSKGRRRGKATSTLKSPGRAEQGGDIDDDIEQAVLKLRQRKARLCSQCGSPVRPGDRFCASCGSSLVRGENGD